MVTANIATDAVASKTSSASDLHGKPAKTHFKVLAHFAGRHGDGTVGGDVTLDGDRWNTFRDKHPNRQGPSDPCTSVSVGDSHCDGLQVCTEHLGSWR